MRSGIKLALTVVGVYVALSALWLVPSDLVNWRSAVFVVVTAGVIGGFIVWYERALDRDLRELRAAQSRLRDSEQRFSRFLDHSPLPAWITDRDGNITWSSRGFRDGKLSGDPESELRAGGYAVYRFPVDDRGDAVGHIAADLSERERDADELRAELDRLMSAVSHDLRAPLRSLTGFSTALQEDYGARIDDKGAHYLRRIHDAAEMMGRLIDALLELSGVSQQRVQRSTVDVAALARAEIDRLRMKQPTREVEVRIPASIPLNADPALMRQAVEHLVANAWQYTAGADGARIEMKREQDGDATTVAIIDNGTGFDMAYAHKLFTPFQRLHEPGAHSGTGIGLAVTQRIIQRHGGSIWLESEPGKGTTVRFTIG